MSGIPGSYASRLAVFISSITIVGHTFPVS